MADYIRREDIFNVISIGRLEYPECDSVFDGMDTEIKRIPSADVAEVRHGKWRTVDIFSEKGYGERYYQHKECSTELYKSPYNFCPNCGADMRKGGGT